MSHFPAQPLGRRDRRKEATRRELMRAGRKLFAQKGLYESRIEDLTGTAGIAKGTLYLYFRNKEALVLDVTAAGYEELRRHVAASLGPSRTTRGLARAMVRSHLEFFARNPDLMRIFHQVRGILKFRRPEWSGLDVPLEGHIRFLARSLGRASKPLSAGARRRLAIQIYGTVSGVTSVFSVLEPHRDLLELLPLIEGWKERA